MVCLAAFKIQPRILRSSIAVLHTERARQLDHTVSLSAFVEK